MFSFWISFAVGIVSAIIVSKTILWVIANLESYTPEWREERLIEWLNRPLPTLEEKYRKEIRNSYHSEEWEKYPYCLIDAICDPKKNADEVIRWVGYYV